jgi:PKD repeat protein
MRHPTTTPSPRPTARASRRVLTLSLVTLTGCGAADGPAAPDAPPAARPARAALAVADAIRIVTFGDSNTDQGYDDGTVSARVRAYVSRAPLALAPTAPNDPRQLAAKIERQWRAVRPEPLIAVNHGISGTTTGGGDFGGSDRTSYGSPNARTPVGGVTRFEAEVLGVGAPGWHGGEPVNGAYPAGPVTRVNARPADDRTVAYISMGTNDARSGWSSATTARNLAWMVDRWIAAGRRADHLVVTTLAPIDLTSYAGRVAAVNDSVRALAARTGVHLVDLAAHVSADNGRTWRSDTLHQGDRLHYRGVVREWIAEQFVVHVARLYPGTGTGRPPVARFTVGGTPVEGTTLTFDARTSSDPDGDALTYAWAFGDGTTAAGAVVTHAYADEGSMAATLTVRDPAGHVAQVAQTVAVTNAAPVVSAGRDTTVVAGRSVTYGGATFADAGAGDSTWSHTVAWGDGTTSSSTAVRVQGALPRLAKTYAQPGTYAVERRVRDVDGATGTGAFTVTVRANTAPTAAAGGPYVGDEGVSLRFASTGTVDPDGDALGYRWEFGDGTTSTAPAPSKRYGDEGTYTVRLIVTDPSGARDTATTTATIANVAPTGRLEAPSGIHEGSGYTVSLTSVADVSADEPSIEVALDCGLGAGYGAWSASVRSVACPVQPDDRAPVTVRGRVRDGDGGVREYARTMSVRNATPQVTLQATSPTTIPIGGAFAVEGRFTDPGALDGPWTYTITWGDGTTSTGRAASPDSLIAASHAYANAGTYTAFLTVRDNDAATGRSASLTVTVPAP